MSEGARVLIVFCGRFLNEKADSLFAHESARAFAQLGRETFVLAPRRLGRSKPRKTPYTVVYLPTIDLMRIPFLRAFANYLNLALFSSMVFLWFLVKGKRDDIVLSNEPLPLLLSSFVLRNIVYEVHVIPKKKRWLYRALLHRTRLLLPITKWNAKLGEHYGFPRERVLLARSAVNTELFQELDKKVSRERLALPADACIALYTGHLYPWKGVDTLAEAARLTPDIEFIFVGGTEPDIAAFKEKYGLVSNIRIAGYRPHGEIPLWQAAADVLVLPNSSREQISLYYTSPMKLFEYMASNRPIIASDLPSIKEVLPESIGYFAEPDEPASFAKAMKHVFAEPSEAARRASAALHIAHENTWIQRSQRILHALQKRDETGVTG